MLSLTSVATPVINPVDESKFSPAGSAGDISQTAPGTLFAGGIGVSISTFSTRTMFPPSWIPNGLESGPPIQIGQTEFGPSQIPSPSVSGFSGSVP